MLFVYLQFIKLGCKYTLHKLETIALRIRAMWKPIIVLATMLVIAYLVPSLLEFLGAPHWVKLCGGIAICLVIGLTAVYYDIGRSGDKTDKSKSTM